MNMWRWVGSMVVMTGLFFFVVAGVPVTGQDAGGKKAVDDGGKKAVDDGGKKAGEVPPKADPPKADPPKADPAKETGGWVLKALMNKGTSFYQELTTDTTQLIKVMGQEVKQDQKQTFYVQWTPVEVKGDSIVVSQKIIGIKMKIDIGGNVISYDSVDTTAKNPMTDFFNALLNSELKLTIDSKTLQVTNVEGASALVEKLSGTNAQLAPLLKSILSDEAIKQMTEPTWGAVPTKAVKIGDTWTKDLVLNLGGIGTYKTKYTYKLESEDAKEAKIGIKADLTYEPSADKKSLPFKINSAKLSSTEGTGTAVFNKEKGRIEKCDMNMKLEGTLNIEISGMTADVTLNQTQVSTVKTTDANPLPAPSKKS